LKRTSREHDLIDAANEPFHVTAANIPGLENDARRRITFEVST
jgi:hypothetical protein